MLGKGNQSTRRKPAPAPLCPPQIPPDLTRARTQAIAAGSRRLTALASLPDPVKRFRFLTEYLLALLV
jgi:hypothetical protein